jgi:hypothetical protein
MRATKLETAEVVLREILDVLASTLMRLDLTPARLAQISRVAFVKAAASHARMRSGRPHIARIAARVGLSRPEVKRIVDARFTNGHSDSAYAPRAIKVVEAWRRCSPYVSRGKPRLLRLGGKSPSFESLCREHSGDIPYRVILDELVTRNLVSLSTAKRSVLLLPNAIARRHPPELDTLVYAAAFLTELTSGSDVLVRKKVRIATPSTITEKYFEGAIASQIGDLVDGLPTMFGRKQPKTKRKVGVHVYALVARAK